MHCTHAFCSPFCKSCSTKPCRPIRNYPNRMRWTRNPMTNFHYLQVKRGWSVLSSPLPHQHQHQHLSPDNHNRNQPWVDNMAFTLRNWAHWTIICSLTSHYRTNRCSFQIIISTIFKPPFQIYLEDGMGFSMKFPSHRMPSRRTPYLTLPIHLARVRCWVIDGPRSCTIMTS
jgi:hypothetical protein